MKATHRLFRWTRWENERKYLKERVCYKARIKKDGTIVFWMSCSGGRPYIYHLNNEKDANTVRVARHEGSNGIKKFFSYYTLEAL
jgi:hypothetical protein